MKFKDPLENFDFLRSPLAALLEKLESSENGLSEEAAEERLKQYGLNEPAKKKKRTLLSQILSKFFNPLVIVLVVIAAISFLLNEKVDAVLVFLMIFMSVGFTFLQEYRASQAAEKLSEMVRVTTMVLRDGESKSVKVTQIVPGDIVSLSSGNMIPADIRLFACKDLFLNQASLTGESFPVEKTPQIPSENIYDPSTLALNMAYMGSSVVSGTGLGVVVKTGIRTRFGALARELATMHVDTHFDRGVRSFTWLMIRAMLVLVAVIFLINFFTKHSMVEALLFSLAISVGLTPEMLPVIVMINLSQGAMAMARQQVIVKRLNSIQNFGAMDTLCTDKTGTLTLDKIVLERHCDVVGKENTDVLRMAYINSFYQTGLLNLLDKAILGHETITLKSYEKMDEIPFDFSRKVMSVVVKSNSHHLFVTKGAPEEIFKRCTHYELDDEIFEMEDWLLADLKEEYDSLSSDGFRVLAVAYKKIEQPKTAYSKDDEKNLILKGYLAFLDPPKPDVKETIESLHKLGIQIKVLTGDNELVTKKICADVGLDVQGLVNGAQVEQMKDDELCACVEQTTVFARLSPFQKERVIRALHRNKHTVGYLGDGINDALALKVSDVGISVDNAVDIAKESADIILLRKSFRVLAAGVLEGRRTFGNTIKYIKMSSSSNFGNMLSMTGASLLLPFLPMTPVQVLLNNFLYDLSQVAIPSDHVDPEYVEKPRPWNIQSIWRFMIRLGPISSLFDFVTFGALYFIFKANADFFHTGWFVESLCSQTLVIYIIRTGKIPFVQSQPSALLFLSSIVIVGIGCFLPFSHFASSFGFTMLPWTYFALLAFILMGYFSLAMRTNRTFVRRFGYD